MKRFYTLVLILPLVLLFACSKDVLKRYDKRIVGTWRISDVNRIGIGGDRDNLPFGDGSFTFRDDGTLTYTDAHNAIYQGNWDIVKKRINEETVRSLHVTAINFNNQHVCLSIMTT